MRQLLPRVQTNISYATSLDFWTVNSGGVGANLSSTFGPNVARIPLPWATTVRNLVLYSRASRAYDIAVTLLKNNGLSSLTGTLPAASNGPITVPGIDVSYAALDDFSYRALSTPVPFPGNIVGWAVEAESIGNIFGVSAVSGSYAVDTGGIAGALGNGFFQSYDRLALYARSTTYSICATPGTLAVLALKSFGGVPAAGSSWIAYYILNGIVQDGSLGTVDTRCELTSASATDAEGNPTALATFALPLVKGDVVDVAYYLTGTTSPFMLANVAVGVGFIPTTDGFFMLTGGSNNPVAVPTGYVWVTSDQNETNEARALAPIGPAGLITRGLYVERLAPGLGSSYVHTVRHNEGPTAASVTLVDDEASKFVDSIEEHYAADDTIDLESVGIGTPNSNSRLYWGLEATVEGVEPPPPETGTLIVRKVLDGSDDTTTEFPIEVGGGLSPASLLLTNGASQTYPDVPAGSGYSVAEPAPPDGWVLTGIAVDNGSPADNISVGAGETVTATVTNALVPPTIARARRRWLRRAPHLDASDSDARVFHHEFQLDMETGVGNDDRPNPRVMFRFSDDGGKTWSNEKWREVGLAGEFGKRVIWRRLGHSRDRIYEVSGSDPVKTVLIDAQLRATRGQH